MLRPPTLTTTATLATLLAACSGEPEPTARQTARQTAPEVQHASLVPAVESSPAPAADPFAGVESDDDEGLRFASLAPSGSFLWLQVASLDELIQIGNQFAFWGGPGMDLEQGLKLFPVPGVVEHIDRGRPIGLAVGFAGGTGSPETTIVLPVTDRGAVIRAFNSSPEEMEVFGLDDYVVASTLPEYVPSAGISDLTRDLPEGQIVARVDVPALLDGLGMMVSMGLGQMKQQLDLPADAGGPENELEREMRLAVIEGMETAIESAASLDLALDQSGEEIDLSFTFVAREGSALDGLLPPGSGSLRDLARCIDDEDALGMLVAIDPETLSEHVLPLWRRAIEGAGETALDAAAGAWLEELAELWPLCGDAVVATGDLDESGLRLAYYFRPTDTEAFVDGLTRVLTGLGDGAQGLRVDGPVEIEGETHFMLSVEEAAEGINLEEIARRREDLEDLFGSNYVQIRLAEREGATVLTVGGDEDYLAESAARLDREAHQVPAELEAALDALGDANPAFVMRMDLVGFMSEFADLIESRRGMDAPGDVEWWRDLAGEEPLPIVYYGGVDGLEWVVGFRVDLARFGELMKRAGR